MTVYWLIFLVPALATLSPFRGTLQLRRASWLLVGLLLCFLIGLRHQVGGDWYSYLDNFNGIVEFPFMEAVTHNNNVEFGFYGLSWLIALAGLGVYTLNLVCAFIFVAGLVVFCRQQPLPWLTLAIAVPYLVTVVAMGYTRQAAAMGFLFVAISTFRNFNQFRYVFLVLLAGLFHGTALLWMPLGLLVTSPVKVVKTAAGFAVLTLLVVFILAERYDELWLNYVEAGMVSEGGPIRVWMNAVAGIVLLVTRKNFRRRWPDISLWLWLSLLALVFVPLVEFASTAVDRIAIYLIPLQLFVFSRLPVLVSDVFNRTLAIVGILAAYASVLWVWLNFGVYAQYWLPYNNVAFLPFLN